MFVDFVIGLMLMLGFSVTTVIRSERWHMVGAYGVMFSASLLIGIIAATMLFNG